MVGARCDNGLADARRRDPAARPVCAARQQLSRLRLCPVLGARSGAMPSARLRRMAALITSSSSREFAAALPTAASSPGSTSAPRPSASRSAMPAGTSPARARPSAGRNSPRTSSSLRTSSSREHVVGLVVGLPLNMDGSDSPRTQSVRAFARNLAPLELPILLWDERWSTQAVDGR